MARYLLDFWHWSRYYDWFFCYYLSIGWWWMVNMELQLELVGFGQILISYSLNCSGIDEINLSSDVDKMPNVWLKFSYYLCQHNYFSSSSSALLLKVVVAITVSVTPTLTHRHTFIQPLQHGIWWRARLSPMEALGVDA